MLLYVLAPGPMMLVPVLCIAFTTLSTAVVVGDAVQVHQGPRSCFIASPIIKIQHHMSLKESNEFSEKLFINTLR